VDILEKEMTTLTKTAITTRKIIRYGILGVILIIIGRFVIGAGIGIYRYFFPAPPPPPTVSFGKLPDLAFPDGVAMNGPNYTIETPEGALPTLKTQAKVFFMPKQSPNLLSLESARQKAVDLGFVDDPQEVSDTIYRFPHKSEPATLQINIVTGIFSISYNLSADSSPLERIPPASEIAASQVRSYLSSADLLPEDLTGPTTNEFLKVEGGQLVSALGQSEADLVKINLFRKTYEEYPSLTPNPNEANVWFYVSGAREKQKQFVAAEYHYFPVDESQSATYPIKTAQEALNELKAGNAYVASAATTEGNITIRRIYLAYYDSGKPSEFFQPIIVFEGDGFIAYVPAVTSDYYGE
jgi:hypothetical protein